jgi:hypothetical protein
MVAVEGVVALVEVVVGRRSPGGIELPTIEGDSPSLSLEDEISA